MTGLQVHWHGCAPTPEQRIYFANHSSHLDFWTLWSALPKPLRKHTKPVAAKDYWHASGMRKYIVEHLVPTVLIERRVTMHKHCDAIDAMLDELQNPHTSLILFPEGTRNTATEIAPFKTGLYQLATARPDIDLIPVYLENLSRILPKGEFLPIPLLGSITFGEPLHILPDEDKHVFLERTRNAILHLQKI